MSCSAVFLGSLQEYWTACSNGASYRTRSRPLFKDWEMHQMFPAEPQKPLPSIGSPDWGHINAEHVVQQQGRLPAKPWTLDALHGPRMAALAAECRTHNESRWLLN